MLNEIKRYAQTGDWTQVNKKVSPILKELNRRHPRSWQCDFPYDQDFMISAAQNLVDNAPRIVLEMWRQSWTLIGLVWDMKKITSESSSKNCSLPRLDKGPSSLVYIDLPCSSDILWFFPTVGKTVLISGYSKCL